MKKLVFQSYFLGGFECSTHRNYTGRRLDVIEGTRHEQFAELDYQRLLNIGIGTARDGIRWHLIEREPFQYDFASALRQIRAARKTGIQIIWDLLHYGYPDDLDIFSADFPVRFASFAKAFTEFLLREDNRQPFFCPVNEISFFSWIAAQVGGFYPFQRDRGDELKRQLVRASIKATDAIRAVAPNARFVQPEPSVEVFPDTDFAENIIDAANYRAAQFDAFDMLIGKKEPELGGAEKYLDIIGVNYYSDNQWRHPSGQRVYINDPQYRPLNEILLENFQRYNRPLLIAETGIEDLARPEWFRYICEQVKIAEAKGAPMQGICLYPILNHPGWDDDRHCHNGLWDYADDYGNRKIYAPLAEEIGRQKFGFNQLSRAAHR